MFHRAQSGRGSPRLVQRPASEHKSMNSVSAEIDWRRSPSLTREAIAFLAIFSPPNAPYGFDRFVAGVRQGQLSLLGGRKATFSGRPLDELLNELQRVLGKGIGSSKTHWDQDDQHGTGITAYRSFAQTAPKGASAGFDCLLGVLLGILLVRQKSRSVTLEAIKSLARFIRLASAEVQADYSDDRRSIVAMLPGSFSPIPICEALDRSRVAFPRLSPRIVEVTKAVRALALSFGELDVQASTEFPSPASPIDKRESDDSSATQIADRRPAKRSILQTATVETGQHESFGDVDASYLVAAHGLDPAGMDALAAAAETVDDQIASSEGLTTVEPIGSRSFVQRRAAALRYRSDVRQGFWSRIQWDALTPGEAKYAIQRLLEFWKIAESTDDVCARETAALGLLSATTGFPLARSHMTKVRVESGGNASPDQIQSSDFDYFDSTDGSLSIPLVLIENRFKPSLKQARLLQPVEQSNKVFLPKEIESILGLLKPDTSGFLFATELTSLEGKLRDIFSEERDREPRYTAARLIRAHQLEILQQSGDVAASQILTGQTLGTSVTPLAYYAAPTGTLQEIYNRTITNSGLTPSSRKHGEASRVGSQLLLKPETIGLVSRSVSRGLLNAPRKSRSSGRQLLELHQLVVPSLALLWMAGTGFRPTFRLGEITSASFDLTARLAVIADKKTDESHLGRLVPLPPVLVRSLAAYGYHLEKMVANTRLTSTQRSFAQDALSGGGPLFFLASHSGPRPLAPEDLLKRLPGDWILPLNFLRHRLATRLREVGCPGPYVQAVIGHYELGIQPFSDESFMEPNAYLESTGSHIETLLHDDGWRPLLGGSDNTDVFIKFRPAVGIGVLTLEESLTKEAAANYQAQRDQVESARAEHGSSIANRVQDIVKATHPALFSEPQVRHELSKEQVAALRHSVCENAENMTEVEIRILSLRTLLSEGRERHGWRVKQLPNFYPLRAAPTTHHPSFVAAYSAQVQLREHYIDHLENHPGEPNSEILKCVLALILWHGISDRERLHSVLNGISTGHRLIGTSDAYVVPTFISRHDADPDPLESCEVLRGAVALAAIAARAHLDKEVSSIALERLLFDWCPQHIVSAGRTRILDVMLAIASITHRFESPAPLRNVWSGQLLSVSMPAARLQSLFGQQTAQGLGSPDEFHEPMEQPTTPTHQLPQLRESRIRYQWLKDTIRFHRHKPKTFPTDPFVDLESGNLSSKGRVPANAKSDSAIRKETCAKLELRLAHWQQDGSIVRALTEYALDRLKFGTPWKPIIEQSTVYKYTVGAGTLLIFYGFDCNIHEMDAEDFSDLYSTCLELARPSVRDELAGYLAYFHGFLVEHYGCASISIHTRSNSIRCLPDIGFVTPHEIQQCGRMFQGAIDGATDLSGSTFDIDAAKAALFLGFASGARTNEVLLREDRELVQETGRRALLVRRNRWTRVKTFRGTRVIDLEFSFPEAAWSTLDDWRKTSNSLLANHETLRAPLFQDPQQITRPIDPTRLSRLIGLALKATTRRKDARPYWWRHTAASIEFLMLFADDALIVDLRSATAEEDGIWLPEGRSVRAGLGGDLPLGQSHAACFRSRRGHSRMSVSLETYVHTCGLIEPWASRSAGQKLSMSAIAALAGVTIAAARKRIYRAGLTSSTFSGRAAINVFVAADPAPSSVATSIPDSTLAALQEIEPKALLNSLVRSLRLGKIGSLSSALRLTPQSSRSLNEALAQALTKNVFGFSLAGVPLPEPASELPIAGPDRRPLQPFQRVDRSWIGACLMAMMKNRALLEVWSTVLRGFDPVSGFVAARNEDDFRLLLDLLPQAVGALQGESYVVQPVEDRRLSRAQSKVLQDFMKERGFTEDRIEKSSIVVPAGWLRAGVTVAKRGTGRRVIAGIALLAIASVAIEWVRDQKA